MILLVLESRARRALPALGRGVNGGGRWIYYGRVQIGISRGAETRGSGPGVGLSAHAFRLQARSV